MHIVVSRVILCGTVMDVGCKTPGNHMLKVCVEGKKVFQYLKQLSRLRRKTKRRGGREVRLEKKDNRREVEDGVGRSGGDRKRV